MAIERLEVHLQQQKMILVIKNFTIKIFSAFLTASYEIIGIQKEIELRFNKSESPVVNFINIVCTNFSYDRHFGSFSLVTYTQKKLPKRHLYEKFVRKMLMKLTPASLLLRGQEEHAQPKLKNKIKVPIE